MASFSRVGGGGGGVTGGSSGGGGVFIGSFNINSQDLSNEAAKAWLKEAEDADIVALGLQVCHARVTVNSSERHTGFQVSYLPHFHDMGVLTSFSLFKSPSGVSVV